MRTRCLFLCFVLVGMGVSCGGNEAEPLGEEGASGSQLDGNRGGSSGKEAAGGSTGWTESGRGAGGAIREGGSVARGGAGPSTGGRNNRGGAAGKSDSAGGESVGGAPGDGGAGSGPGGAKGGAAGIAGPANRGGSAGIGGSGAGGGSMGAGGRGPEAAGAAGVGGSSGGGGQTICGFTSGLNVAWVNFARDVPSPDLATFNTIFKNTYAAGGRVVRWWFHTNGTTTPGYDSDGKAQKIQQSHIDGVKAILGAADAAGIAVNISLWSFDMLQSNAGTTYTNNLALLENDTNRQAYIDNYLAPLVKALQGTPGLYSYEIFNEPEGMAEEGWATHKTQEKYIQKTVNWFAAAIHDADPTVPVTNGAQTFDYCSAVSGKTNYYSDSALRSAGGKENGTLDFYEVHYYTSNGESNSPFKNKASYWGLTDKKLVIGEFAAQDTDGVGKNDTYAYLYTNGYNGAWAWAYESDYPWPAMQQPMQNLFKAYADVGSCP